MSVGTWRLAYAVIAGIALSLGLLAPAMAQRAEPPRVAPTTREEIQHIPSGTAVAPAARLSVAGAIEHSACALDDPRFATIGFTLGEVRYTGLEGVDPASLRPAFAEMIGKPLPVAAVCTIRDAVATRLRAAGYVASVRIPPQRIANGVVALDVLMARVVAVHVEGVGGRGARAVAAYLARLEALRPFNQNAAERLLLLIRRLPGYQVQVTLQPAGGAPGEVIAAATVTRTPVELEASAQDYGSRAIGRWSGYARVGLNGVLGLGDRATIGVSNSFDRREQTVVEGAYEIRPGSSGLLLSAHVTDAWTRPDLGPVDPLHERSLIYGFEASRPLVVKRARGLAAAAGIELIDQRIRFVDTPFNEDRLRVLYARLTADAFDRASVADRPGYNAAEPRWRAAGSIELRHGIDGLGASHGCGGPPYFLRCLALPTISRFDGDPQAGLIRAGATLEWRPSPGVALVLAPSAQYAFAPLLSYEQYSAGNYTIGRGYDPGALIGDSGVGTQAELRLGHIVPAGLGRLALQPFVFTDAAWVWTRGPLAATHGARSLVSAGWGVRAALGDRARLDMTLAVPLRDTPFQTTAGDVRLLFSLTTRLIPWRHS